MSVLVHLHDGSDVATLVGVVRSRPHSDKEILLREGVLVSFENKLMCTRYERKLVQIAELEKRKSHADRGKEGEKKRRFGKIII